MDQAILNHLMTLARKAGDAILAIAPDAMDVQRKADKSPVTRADEAAHEIIDAALQQLLPGVPVISEEAAQHVLPASGAYWLVDPLDGTRGFIRGSIEYTVNIALIEDGVPAGGVIVQPVTRLGYAGGQNMGAYRESAHGEQTRLATSPPLPDAWRALVSAHHLDEQTEQLLKAWPVTSRKNLPSSLKFCLLADGEADIYPRYGPTMEWDTAAGQAILEAAGGALTTLDGKRFCYGKPAFRNTPFIAFAHHAMLEWMAPPHSRNRQQGSHP